MFRVGGPSIHLQRCYSLPINYYAHNGFGAIIFGYWDPVGFPGPPGLDGQRRGRVQCLLLFLKEEVRAGLDSSSSILCAEEP